MTYEEWLKSDPRTLFLGGPGSCGPYVKRSVKESNEAKAISIGMGSVAVLITLDKAAQLRDWLNAEPALRAKA